LVVEPTMDRVSNPDEVRDAVTQAKRAYALYQAEDKLSLDEPQDYTRLTTATENRAVAWLNRSQHPDPVPAGPVADAAR
jgi:hypothetical protein